MQEGPPTTVDSKAGSVPVLLVELRASESGYVLVSARRSLGTPSLAFDPDREVLVTALKSDGSRLASISVPNPRTAHSAGEKEARELVLESGSLSLRLPDPDSIRALELFVRRGPNEGFHQVFRID